MRKIVEKFRIASVVFLGVAFASGLALHQQPTYAACGSPAECIAQPVDELNDGKKLDGQGGYIQIITNTLLFVIGAISVIVIIVGGIKYATSDGDPSKIKSAKDTILYAIVGIVIAILAFALVQFITTQFGA